MGEFYNAIAINYLYSYLFAFTVYIMNCIPDIPSIDNGEIYFFLYLCDHYMYWLPHCLNNEETFACWKTR